MFDIIPITSRKENDCGATCLKMLLAFYGQDIPLDQLITECNTGITGCTAKDLLRAGRLHGQDMKAYKTDADGILSSDRPAIIWWMYRHFVVYAGIDEETGKVWICNPDKGRYRVSKATFASFYTNIAVCCGEMGDLQPDPEGEAV